HARFGDLLFEGGGDLVGAGGEASGGGADADVMLEFRAGGALGFGDVAEFLESHWPMPFSMRASMSAGPILPITALSSTTAGARPHEPRQRAVRTESLPSGVVSPGLMP